MHNPLIVYWPKGIKEKGGVRNQYSHVIDMLPTTLDLVGIKAPEEIRGIKQQPVEGFSFADSINDAKAPWHHTEQYYHIFGSRSIYKDGWKAELAYPWSFQIFFLWKAGIQMAAREGRTSAPTFEQDYMRRRRGSNLPSPPVKVIFAAALIRIP